MNYFLFIASCFIPIALSDIVEHEAFEIEQDVKKLRKEWEDLAPKPKKNDIFKYIEKKGTLNKIDKALYDAPFVYENSKPFRPEAQYFLTEYGQFSRDDNENKLMMTGKKIGQRLGLPKNVTVEKIIYPVVAEHVKNLDYHFLQLYKSDKYKSIASDAFILDVVDFCSDLLHDSKKKMLNIIVNLFNKTTTQANIKKMEEEIIISRKIDKRDAMRFVCEINKICKPYPAFSDYLADLSTVILNLKDEQLSVFVEKVLHLIKQKSPTKIQLKERIKKELNHRIGNGFKNVLQIRSFVSTIRDIILNRYKIQFDNDVVKPTYVASVRIAMDMLDKCFILDGPEMLEFDFGNILSTVKSWSEKPEYGMHESLDEFIRHLLQSIKYIWNNIIAEEVNTLIEIILHGKAKHEEFGENLLSKGSKFLKGEGSPPEMDIVWRNGNLI